MQSILYVNGGILSSSSQTKLNFDASSTDFMNIRYNTLYPLIITEQAIEDDRDFNHQDIEIINAQEKLPEFLIPQTFNEEKRISLVFKKGDEPIKPPVDPNPPIDPNPVYDWFEQYILDVLILSDPSLKNNPTLADSKLQDVLNTIGEDRPIMEAIVQTNLEQQEIFLKSL